jgi:Amt family ammonium transporter
MKLSGLKGWAGLALAATLVAAPLAPAFAQQPAAPAAAAAEAAPATAPVAAPAAAPAAIKAPPQTNKGDTTWMMISAVLVLLMIVPGLALFYGGLVRQKNMLSMLMQTSTVCVIGMIAWVVYGYSFAFTDGGSHDAFVGGFSRLFLKGVTPASLASRPSRRGLTSPNWPSSPSR